MRGRRIAALLVVSGCALDAPTATTSQAIIDGDPTTDYPSTGVVVAAKALRCTGTLIAQDVVLTAAHCLEPPTFGHLGFTLDADLSDGTQNVVNALITHKHPWFAHDGSQLRDLAERNDIGIMILERPIIGAPLQRLDLLADIQPGTQAALCGYGRSQWDRIMAGVKREAMLVIDRTDELEMSTTSEGPQPCSGDSGGPLFVETPEGLVMTGIVSRALGDSVMCNSGAIVTRLDPYLDWIADASTDRDTGCSAGRSSGWAVLFVALFGLRRRRR